MKKIIMQFGCNQPPLVLNTIGFGTSCVEHMQAVARIAGSEVELGEALPDKEVEPLVKEQTQTYIAT